MKRLLWALVGACLMTAAVSAVDGPLTPFGNLRGRTDANGYLMVRGGAYTAADGPLTNLANLRVRTDSNGYLIVALTGGSFTGQLLAPTGCTTVPYSFTADPTKGFCSPATNKIGVYIGGSELFEFNNSGLDLINQQRLQFSSSASCCDIRLRPTASKTLTFDDGAGGAATFAVTGSITSTAEITAGTNLKLGNGAFIGTVGQNVIRFASGVISLSNAAENSKVAFQTAGTPTCSTNCGTSPSVSGSDSSMTVTMGASGSPASGWVVTFAGTWTAAPQCHVTMALAGMVVGKMPLTCVTTTTTATVVTNGTAPANGDKYHLTFSLGS